ncbi:zinc ribbon domain-containing protein [Methanobrevibacter sp.]|uniref:zinc ribbon domain-containing protein n=1 Tax=Methanobrevibacter sp. TaxID=66852 RepID=UPI00386B9D9C
MKCPKCGSENSSGAKFCKSCGGPLENTETTKTENKNRMIIIALVAAIAVLAIGVVLASGVLNGVELENQEFEGFKMDVPVDSKFVLDESYTTNPKNIFVGYLNDGEHQMDAFGFQVGNNLSEDTVAALAEFDHSDGDIKIYKNESDGDRFYEAFKEGNDANIVILGDNVDVITKMAKSFNDKGFKKLAKTSEDSKPVTTQTSQSTQASAPATTSMSILGGSFSTGSELEDKTYASIYVGANHAGESVQLQIWYSRDGSTLNHGNMVPVTVDSSGYLEVSSADAYSKFPDFAEINLYDGSGSKLLDTRSVSLSPTSGTQNF